MVSGEKGVSKVVGEKEKGVSNHSTILGSMRGNGRGKENSLRVQKGDE